MGNQAKITQFLQAERYAVVIQTACGITRSPGENAYLSFFLVSSLPT